MALPAHVSIGERLWFYAFRIFCGAVFIFLITPILILVPLSFNAEPYFSFTSGMLSFDPEAFSLRWYKDILENGMADRRAPFSWDWLADSWANGQWMRSIRNSFFIATISTLIATVLGTVAALGLSQSNIPARNFLMGLLIAPMIVPLIITAAALYFFLSDIGLSQTYTGIILAHAVLGTPFVVITVTATLVGFDRSLMRAGANLGAPPQTVFFKVMLPLITPGVVSGALFAFITSFDEVVAVLFLAGFKQRTIPLQMWAGLREQISPTILAVATIMVIISICLLTTLEMLRRRSERLRGITPH